MLTHTSVNSGEQFPIERWRQCPGYREHLPFHYPGHFLRDKDTRRVKEEALFNTNALVGRPMMVMPNTTGGQSGCIPNTTSAYNARKLATVIYQTDITLENIIFIYCLQNHLSNIRLF